MQGTKDVDATGADRVIARREGRWSCVPGFGGGGSRGWLLVPWDLLW